MAKISRKQWDAMSPAMQAMWVMQHGTEPDFPTDQPDTPRANRMQEATEDFQKVMARVRGNDD